MAVSAAALSFLILAAALGSQARAIDETLDLLRRKEQTESPILHEGFHQPAHCCFSYMSRLPCKLMKDYFETSSGCSKPAVIFRTKKERYVCADPQKRNIQNCMMNLSSSTVSKKLGTRKPE